MLFVIMRFFFNSNTQLMINVPITTYNMYVPMYKNVNLYKT